MNRSSLVFPVCRRFSHSSCFSPSDHAVSMDFHSLALGSPSDSPIPVIFLHCLLGNRSLYHSFHSHLSRAFSSRGLSIVGFFPDFRNHGKSAHTKSHNYFLLVEDLLKFMQKHRIESPFLVGHSMGGKAALAYALSYGNREFPGDGEDSVERRTPTFPSLSSSLAYSRVSGLISLDASPADYSHSHSAVFDALERTSLKGLKNRAAVEGKLAENGLEDRNDRAFVMQFCLSSHNIGDSTEFRWSPNVPVLSANERLVHQFPFQPTAQHDSTRHHGGFPYRSVSPYNGPALFIGGSKSSRLTAPSYLAEIPAFFPKAEHAQVDSGHFVMNAQPVQCSAAIADFLAKHPYKGNQ